MLNLLIKTDQPLAGLYLFEDMKPLYRHEWQADKELAESINREIDFVLKESQKKMTDLEGIGIFSGPGSFTGLRIGHSVANALAYGLSLPISSGKGKSWQKQALTSLLSGENEVLAMPDYGRDARITTPRK